jgi:hypothetical protein
VNKLLYVHPLRSGHGAGFDQRRETGDVSQRALGFIRGLTRLLPPLGIYPLLAVLPEPGFRATGDVHPEGS